MAPHRPTRFGGLALAVGLCILSWLSPSWAGQKDEGRASTAIVRLSGTMPLDDERCQGLAWSGAWQFPVANMLSGLGLP